MEPIDSDYPDPYDTDFIHNSSISTKIEVSCYEMAEYCYEKLHNISLDEMEDCFLDVCFASRTMEAVTLYPLTAAYFLIFLIGVMGNLTTCIIMNRAEKYARTSTGRYLSHLALADLIVLLSGVPFEIYLGWNQYPWHPPDFVCHLKAWLLETTSYVSVLTILAFSLERYVAICHSFRANAKLMQYRRRMPKIQISLWIVAGICATPYSFYHRADYTVKEWLSPKEYGPIKRTKMCMLALAFDPNLKPTFQFLFHASAILFFFLPLIFLVFMYVRMALIIRRTRKDLRSFKSQQSNSALASNVAMAILKGTNEASVLITPAKPANVNSGSQDYGSRKVFYMLAAVVISFFMCYAPYQIQRLLFFYMDDNSSHATVNTYLYLVSGVLFYLNSTLNPILYSVMSMRFRSAFSQIFCHCNGNPKMSSKTTSIHNQSIHRRPIRKKTLTLPP